MKKIFIFGLIAIMAMCSCESHTHKEKDWTSANQDVKCYKEKKQNSDGTWEYVYWYMLLTHNSGGNVYHYYSSPTAINSVSGINWTTSTTAPIDFNNSNSFEESTGFQTSISELPQDIQSDFTESQGFESPNSDANDPGYTESSGFESSPSSDNSSSTESSSSDGGGDSGGGDGGGGD